MRNKPIKDLRNNRITFRLSDDEYDRMIARAGKLNMTLSEFSRRAALEKEIISFDEDNKLYYQLMKIGNNVNQLTMLSHQKKINIVDLGPVKELLTSLKREMLSIRKV